tara:strand:+ start:234 stop:431 length:198 start_codon:yes stop_codon:yes gene_type:complete
MTKAEEFFRVEDMKDGILRDLMEKYGAEPFLALCEMAGGERLYIPHLKSVLKNANHRMNQVGLKD